MPVQRQVLEDGDEIRICGCVLRFAQRSAAGAGGTKVRNIDQPTDDSKRTPGVDGGHDAPPPQDSDRPPAAMDLSPPPQQHPPRNRVLAMWYAGGLVGSLLFGGALAAVMVLRATPADAAVASAADVAAGAAHDGAAARGAHADGAADKPAADDAAPPGAEGGKAGDGKAGDAAAADAAGDDANGDDAKAGDAEAGDAKDGDAKAGDAKAGDAKAGDAKAGDANVAAVAAAEKDVPNDDVDAAPDAADKAPERHHARRHSSRSSASSASSSSSSSDDGDGRAYGATVDGGHSESLRTKSGGQVKSVEAKNGDDVKKGQVLVSFDAGDNANAVATLRDRIASLEGVDDDDARRDLAAAKEKLSALQGKAGGPIVAGMSGKLTGFTVAEGAVLKPGETVGRIVEGEASKRVRVSVPRSAHVRRGQDATLVLKHGGEGAGKVASVSGHTVIVDCGDLDADEVSAVKF